jgi:hypothetical protein
MRNTQLLSLLISLTIFGWAARPARADDVYVVDADAIGPRLANGCSELLWAADTVFYNLTSADAVVTLLGVSNGEVHTGAPTTFSVKADSAASIRQKVGGAWQPTNGPALWVYRLNIAAGIEADSEMFPSLLNRMCPGPVVVLQPFGKARLPVFKKLVPSGHKQVLTGLTLGDQASRVNIAIYNAGTEPAGATLEMHRACDGVLVQTRSVVVPSNVIQQFGAFSLPETDVACTKAYNGPNGLNRLAYAVVTVTQPSFSFASVLSNEQSPVSTIQISAPAPP